MKVDFCQIKVILDYYIEKLHTVFLNLYKPDLYKFAISSLKRHLEWCNLE